MTDAFAPGLLSRLGSVRSLAIVRASRIGDFICATPAFRALRAALSDAKITVIALPLVRELYVRSTALDRFEPFPGFPGMAEQFFKARSTVSFLDRLQSRNFDLALQMHGTGVYSNVFTLMLGARATAGFVREGDQAGRLDAAFVMPDRGHETERLLAFTRFLGVENQPATLEFPLKEQDHTAARTLLAGAERPLIGVHAYARKPEKCWPAEKFVEAAVELRKRFGGTVVLIGGDDRRAEGRTAAAMIGRPCLDLTGRTSIGALGGVELLLSVLLTNDSGPAHIAYALGTPTVTLFGETDPDRWGPPSSGPFRVIHRRLPCFPCEEDTCSSGYACLRSISVREVVDAAGEVMRP